MMHDVDTGNPWRDLMNRAFVSRVEWPHGVRVTFRCCPGVVEEARRWAAIEGNTDWMAVSIRESNDYLDIFMNWM